MLGRKGKQASLSTSMFAAWRLYFFASYCFLHSSLSTSTLQVEASAHDALSDANSTSVVTDNRSRQRGESKPLIRREHKTGKKKVAEESHRLEIRSTGGSQRFKVRFEEAGDDGEAGANALAAAVADDSSNAAVLTEILDASQASLAEVRQKHTNIFKRRKRKPRPNGIIRREAQQTQLARGSKTGRLASNDDLYEELFNFEEDEDAELLAMNGTGGLLSASLGKKGAWWSRRRRVDCTFHGWSGWTSCNRWCGTGQKKRSRGRNRAQHGGRDCHGPGDQTSSCLTRHCPVDCKWGAWSGWSPSRCPVTCGHGSQYRKRLMTSHAAYGGKQCDDPWLDQLQVVCQSTPCPIHCAWKPWSGWTSCSVSCGVGTGQRYRDRAHSAEHGGRECVGNHVEDNVCNIHPCPIDCSVGEWLEWSPCDKDCGGGAQGRWRPMFVPDQHGGEPCPHLEENKKCNEDPCLEVEASGRQGAKVHFWVVTTLGSVLLALGSLEP